MNSNIASKLFVAAMVTILCIGCGLGTEQQLDLPIDPASNKAEVGKIELSVDLPEGEDVKLELSCYSDSTVFSVLQDAKESGKLSFEFQGTDDTVFLNSIAGIENSGSGGGNWSFRVNGELGNKSCGVFSVSPDDLIEWRFGKVSFD